MYNEIKKLPDEETHYLKEEENEYFTYEGSFICQNVKFQLYLDDYGQSYFLAWINKEGKLRQYGCGTYGSWKNEMMDIATYESLRVAESSLDAPIEESSCISLKTPPLTNYNINLDQLGTIIITYNGQEFKLDKEVLIQILFSHEF